VKQFVIFSFTLLPCYSVGSVAIFQPEIRKPISLLLLWGT